MRWIQNSYIFFLNFFFSNQNLGAAHKYTKNNIYDERRFRLEIK